MKASDTLFERASSVAMKQKFENGTTFYAKGDPPAGLYYVRSGLVKLSRGSRKKTQILALLGQGEIFGAESLFQGAPCPWTAQAVSQGEVLYLAPEMLEQVVSENPEMLSAFLELVWQRLHEFTNLVHGLAFRDVRARLAGVLVQLATLDGSPVDEGVCIKRTLSQQDLASMVGTAREVVNRTLKRFEQEGLLRISSEEILLLDYPEIERIAVEEVR